MNLRKFFSLLFALVFYRVWTILLGTLSIFTIIRGLHGTALLVLTHPFILKINVPHSIFVDTQSFTGSIVTFGDDDVLKR